MALGSEAQAIEPQRFSSEADEFSTFPTQHFPRKLRLTLGYRGTRYAGWARQPERDSGGRPTLQNEIEAALAQALGHPIQVTAAGRTDAGVHASGQVLSFGTHSSISGDGLARVLGRYLPDDVWTIHCAEVSTDFNARRSAVRRWYRYSIWRGESPPIELQGLALMHPDHLDVPAMRRASALLKGRHDFAALVGQWSRDARPGRTTVRSIYVADWLETSGPLLTFEVSADAFLRQMVRTMVGSLLWVGEGKWSVQQFADALAARDRKVAGPTAPAVGLTLHRIEY